MSELNISQAFQEHQAHQILTPYEPVVKFCSKWVLTPKGPRGVFLQKRSKSAISSSRSPNLPFHIFALSTVGSCTKLLGEHVQRVSRHLTARIVRL
jgi:hypothetical protein